MIGGWRWTAGARKRHYFWGEPFMPSTTSLCGEWAARLNGMEQQDAGPDDCAVCTRKLAKEDRT